jgi:hypothetical protein
VFCFFVLPVAGPQLILYLFLSNTSKALEVIPLVKVTTIAPGLSRSAWTLRLDMSSSEKQVEFAKITSPSDQSKSLNDPSKTAAY